MILLSIVYLVLTLEINPADAFIKDIETLQCTETVPLDVNTFALNSTLSRDKISKEWKLHFTITWEPAITDESLVYAVNVTFEERNVSLSGWNFTDCRGALVLIFQNQDNSHGYLRNSPKYEHMDAPLTRRAVLEVGYVLTSRSPWPISPPTNFYFETPDCYAVTRDAAFCASQSVVRCGHIRDPMLDHLTVENGTITMRFRWMSPVQINAMAVMHGYVVQVNTSDREMLITENVTAAAEVISWVAVSRNESGLMKEGGSYILTVIPYISYTDENSPPVAGRSVEYEFIAEPIKATTTQCTSSPKAATADASTEAEAKQLPLPREMSMSPIVIISAVVLIAGLIFILVMRRRRRRRAIRRIKAMQKVNFNKNPVEEKGELDPRLKEKEIRHDQVTIQRKLGEGEFGVVHKAIMSGIKGYQKAVDVAVKTTKVGAFPVANDDLLSEMKLLADLGDHPNILCLVACCSTIEPYYLITEFMQYGDLRGFLRKCREKDDGTRDPIYDVAEIQQIIIARDIAMGMAHIQEKRFYHGDLAARNVLVGDNLSIKISDFGLADDIYTRGYKRRETAQKIPIKWCSIETILNGICSSQGDVWSFAVLMYEIFTLGGTPYPEMKARVLVSQLKQGYRMEQPASCPNDVYELMGRCWQDIPEERPRFSTISEETTAMLMTRTDYIDFGEGLDDTEVELIRRLSINKKNKKDEVNTTDLPPINDEHNEVDSNQLQDALNFNTELEKALV